MSIDLIEGVMKAADSQRLQDAHSKLAAAKHNKAAATGLFAGLARKVGLAPADMATALPKGRDLVEDVMAAAEPKSLQQAVASLDSAPAAPASDKHRKAMIALEGSLMTNVLEQMMPKAGTGLYGNGTSGEVWRGFQVSQFGEAMAQADVLGLGKADAENPATLASWPHFQTGKIRSFAAG